LKNIKFENIKYNKNGAGKKEIRASNLDQQALVLQHMPRSLH
jgi:hypothetical protein